MTVNDFSIGLLLWQIINFVLLVILVVLIYKLFKFLKKKLK
ncbi:hypothetical protein FVB9532_00337 [Mesonia oceanica]|uniref:Uncharacterized protein n=1 Tax=Mesonia oceanica TaxID=2687242 RepID=A0AC61Y3N7_9FLAO|nr:hypothetical protein FVB9532_00337 [Mesonia oceanica]